jgi:hypothetical protein
VGLANALGPTIGPEETAMETEAKDASRRSRKMIMKAVKYVVVPVVVLTAVGGVLFGTDLFSYVGSATRSIRTSVRDSVPINVELQRARDLLEDIIPEVEGNVRLIAQEEVELEHLQRDVSLSDRALGEDEAKIHKLSALLTSEDVHFTINERQYSRRAVREDLSRRFDRHKEAKRVFDGKKRLLAAREKSLQAAMQMLEKARSRKAILASRIEGLVAQHRLVIASAVGSKVHFDDSKLAQTEKLIRQIKKRLDVAERVLAHEGRFVEAIEVDVVDEADLLSQVERYFNGSPGDALTDVAQTGQTGQAVAAGDGE